MTRQTLASTPAYIELANHLRTLIQEQKMPPGRRLPTEAELAAEHKVSRQTVRRAYQELVARGLVERTRGRGSFASEFDRQWLLTFGSVDDLLVDSADTEMEILEPLTEVVDPQLAGGLGLHIDQVARLTVRRLRDGVPYSYGVIGLPLTLGRSLASTSLASRDAVMRDSVLALLDRTGAVAIAGAKQKLSATAAAADVAPWIGCEVGAPVLTLDQVYFDNHGRAVEVARNLFNPARYEYRVRLRRAIA